MLARLLVAATAVLALTGGVYGYTAPNTPADGATIGQNEGQADPMCLIKTLGFSNELNIYATTGGKGFTANHFHYTCSCNADFQGTIVRPVMIDAGSTAEVSINGRTTNSRDGGNGISLNGAALTNGQLKSTATESAFLPFKGGQNVIVIGVGCNGYADPDCYYQYTITCNKPPTDGGFITGDPQFVGLRGQNYQVHGVSGDVYNIVSDADLQYNSRFVFLNSGACPVVNGKKQKACWSHPGSYLGELGLKTRAGDRVHLTTGDAKTGFASVSVNDKEVAEGETVMLADNLGSVSRNSTHLASVQIGNWDFAFENSDMFVNQRVRVIDSRGLRSHGLLGQTWRETTYPNAIKYIAGSVDDYTIRDGDIFGDDFVFNAHN